MYTTTTTVPPAWNTYYLTHASQLRTEGLHLELDGIRADDFAEDASRAGNLTLAAQCNRRAATCYREAATWYRMAATVDGGLPSDHAMAVALDLVADKLDACAQGLAA